MKELRTNRGYAIYSFDKVNGYELIAVLPERRVKRERITKESIMKWAGILLGPSAEEKHIVFRRVTIGESADRSFRVGPSSRSSKK